MLVDFKAIDHTLTSVAVHYSKSAPAVSRWADSLCERLQDNPRAVSLGEIMVLDQLTSEGFVSPAYAQNTIYKLLATTGNAAGVLDF